MIALDVGTRTLAAAEVVDGAIRRLAVREHEGTPMRGGQVQDLAAVAAGVRALRDELDLPEETPVRMAIAGGLLRTASRTARVNGPGPWTEAELSEAELDALLEDSTKAGKAGELLVSASRGSMVRDGEPVGSLVGMGGREGAWTVLTSWLPLEQVRLKMEAVTRAGFRPETITVEPLAVSTALFGAMAPPATYAVIDIGAGTSDIAIFGPQGLLEAASVPRAGDTLTASIAAALSLDHLAADHVKRHPGAPVRDLWGDEQRFRAATIAEAAEDGVCETVTAIATRLRELAPGLPAGIILVGGGSLWPDLPVRLARELALPEERVRRRGAETVRGIRDETGLVKGPAFLTLLGIILSADSAFSPRRFRRDGASHWALARVGAPFTVADALVCLGEDPLSLFGDPGIARVTDDGVVAGEPGGAPRVQVNGNPATLDTALSHGDEISVRRGADGRGADEGHTSVAVETTPPGNACRDDATESFGAGAGSGDIANAEDVVKQPEHALPSDRVRRVTLDGSPLLLEGLPENADEAAVLAAVLEHLDTRGFVRLNGERLYIGQRRQVVRADRDVYVSRELEGPCLGAITPLPVPRAIEVVIDGKPAAVKDTTRTAVVDGVRRTSSAEVPWDCAISTERGPWRLFEALAVHDGPVARINLNGRPAAWTAEIRSGDEVEFR